MKDKLALQWQQNVRDSLLSIHKELNEERGEVMVPDSGKC